jgi:hypothetical protein
MHMHKRFLDRKYWTVHQMQQYTKHESHPYHLQRLNATNSSQRLGRVEDIQELLASDTGSGLLDGSLLGLSDELLSTESLGVRVKTEENGLVGEGVLLLGEWPCAISMERIVRGFPLTLGDGLTGGSEDGLDLIRVDESGNIGRGDLGGGEPKVCQT